MSGIDPDGMSGTRRGICVGWGMYRNKGRWVHFSLLVFTWYCNLFLINLRMRFWVRNRFRDLGYVEKGFSFMYTMPNWWQNWLTKQFKYNAFGMFSYTYLRSEASSIKTFLFYLMWSVTKIVYVTSPIVNPLVKKLTEHNMWIE